MPVSSNVFNLAFSLLIVMASSDEGLVATIVVDDIANRKDKDSRAEREFTKAVWQELQNVKNPEGRSIAIGTVWHPDDVFSLMPKADIYTCYETGLLTNEQIEAIKHTNPAPNKIYNNNIFHLMMHR